MSKRGENIYKRKDGRWEGRIKRQGECGGRGGYKSIYGKTYKEIKQKMEDYRKNPPKKSRGKLLMGDISERWLDENKSVWKPTTYGAYSQIVNKYIRPSLGKLDIGSIDARMLDEFSKGLGGNEEGRHTLITGFISVPLLSVSCATRGNGMTAKYRFRTCRWQRTKRTKLSLPAMWYCPCWRIM